MRHSSSTGRVLSPFPSTRGVGFAPEAGHRGGLDLGGERALAAGGVVERVDLCADSFVFVGDDTIRDPRDYSTTNWSMITYAGNSQWSREEDIYNPAHFGSLLTDWQAATDAAGK